MSTTEENPSAWRVIPVRDYSPPSLPAQGNARRFGSNLWRIIRPQPAAAVAPAKAEKDLHTLSAERVQHLAATLPLDVISAALTRGLRAEASGFPEDGRPRFIVLPPFHDTPALASHWARHYQAECLAPPTIHDRIAGHSLDALMTQKPGQPWVVAQLEQWFLRQAASLPALRDWLSRVLHGDFGGGLIFCQSWAWAYMRRIWPPLTPLGRTLAPLDGEGLRMLLSHPDDPESVPLQFRSAQSGETLLNIPLDAESAVSSELKILAHRARGHAGYALHEWRSRLRDVPDQSERQSELAADTDATRRTIWVANRQAATLPASVLSEPCLLTLHALLQHDGLGDDLLPRVLPLTSAHLREALTLLTQAGIVRMTARLQWQLTPTRYPEVRAALFSRGYLADDF